MSIQRRVQAFLDLAAEDASAALALAATSNRYAAFHCQQAIEKLVKALLLYRGIEAGVEHHLDVLIDRLACDDPWKNKLKSLEHYSPYATSYRYPTPGGRLSPCRTQPSWQEMRGS